MSFKNITYIILSIAILSGLTIVQSASACSTPVFQYALFRWAPDPYAVFVFYEKKFSDSQKQALSLLDKLANNSIITYKRIKISEINNTDKSVNVIWNNIKYRKASLPLLVVCYPTSSQAQGIVYTKRLSVSSVHQIASSPMRQKIANKLLQGDTIVWLILLSGNDKYDKQVKKMLASELKKYAEQYFQKNMMKIRFAILELHKDDSHESFFINLLSKMTKQNIKKTNQPIVYPIFGKGRILFPIAENKLTPESIVASCDFMTGPCACEVKEQNPGVDFLIDIDWNEQVASSDEFVEQALPSDENFNTSSAPVKKKIKSNHIINKKNRTIISNHHIVIYMTIAIIMICSVIVSLIIYRLRK